MTSSDRLPSEGDASAEAGAEAAAATREETHDSGLTFGCYALHALADGLAEWARARRGSCSSLQGVALDEIEAAAGALLDEERRLRPVSEECKRALFMRPPLTPRNILEPADALHRARCQLGAIAALCERARASRKALLETLALWCRWSDELGQPAERGVEGESEGWPAATYKTMRERLEKVLEVWRHWLNALEKGCRSLEEEASVAEDTLKSQAFDAEAAAGGIERVAVEPWEGGQYRPASWYRVERTRAVRGQINALPDRARAFLGATINALAREPFPPHHWRLRGIGGSYGVHSGTCRILYKVSEGQRLVLVFHVRAHDRPGPSRPRPEGVTGQPARQ